MKEQFVPFDLAVIMKAKGFTEPCLAYFENGLLEFAHPVFHQKHKNSVDNIGTAHWNLPDEEDVYSAPLWQQVDRWLKSVYGIEVTVKENSYSIYGKGWGTGTGGTGKDGTTMGDVQYKAYHEALTKHI